MSIFSVRVGLSTELFVLAACVCSVGVGQETRSPEQIEKDFIARFVTAAGKGYVARPCGFDMDRNGLLGEASDRRVADGKTRDPDGDGVEEDILYVDADRGRDDTGDGSPDRPFRSIQKALDSADGPDDGAEDIIATAGTFHESVTIRHGGAAGHYVRDNFQFPNNPTMIVGWDWDRPMP